MKNTLSKALSKWREENPLRAWRLSLDYSLQRAAAVIGCSWNSLPVWESGAGKPSAASFEALAAAMRTDAAALITQWETWQTNRPS